MCFFTSHVEDKKPRPFMCIVCTNLFLSRMAEGHDKEEIKVADTSPKVEEAEDLSPDNAKDVDVSEENKLPSKEQEVYCIRVNKRY